MSTNELDALRNENQLLRLRISALEDQVESLSRQRGSASFLDEYGLADERYFTKRLRESVLSAERYARFVTLVMVVLPRDTEANNGRNHALEAAARLRTELRQTDLVAYFDSGKILILLEESDPTQAVQALRRVTQEIAEVPQPNYALASYPCDANRDDALMDLLMSRTTGLRIAQYEGSLVHLGDEVMPLYN
jgi:PleD family two-component response regulator